MTTITQTFTVMNDNQLISLITTAQEKLIFMAPGLTNEVANAIKERWLFLGRALVTVFLDSDPEVLRLGYGTLEGLKIIQEAASQVGCDVFYQPGLRIGVIIVDQSIYIYSPKVMLIGAGSTQDFQPNAICLDEVPISILNEIGWSGCKTVKPSHIMQPLTKTHIEEVENDLIENPLMQFDLARTILVFNSRIEFVEVKVKGCSISQKTASIPNYLMTFVKDKEARDRLHSNYKIIKQDSELTEDEIDKDRKRLVSVWLHSLPGYGSVVLRKEKEKLLEGVEKLKQKVKEYQERIKEQLQKEIDHNCHVLYESLLPAVRENHPQEWSSQLSLFPEDDSIEKWLYREIQKAFGSAEDLVENMEVRVLFKGVTYEMLIDQKFIEIVHSVIPDLEITHEEYMAAPSKQKLLL